VVAVRADGGLLGAGGHCFPVHALSIGEDRSVPDPRGLHHELDAVTPAAGVGDPATLQGRGGIGGGQHGVRATVAVRALRRLLAPGQSASMDAALPGVHGVAVARAAFGLGGRGVVGDGGDVGVTVGAGKAAVHGARPGLGLDVVVAAQALLVGGGGGPRRGEGEEARHQQGGDERGAHGQCRRWGSTTTATTHSPKQASADPCPTREPRSLGTDRGREGGRGHHGESGDGEGGGPAQHALGVQPLHVLLPRPQIWPEGGNSRNRTTPRASLGGPRERQKLREGGEVAQEMRRARRALIEFESRAGESFSGR
jgi:hypothetical protein